MLSRLSKLGRRSILRNIKCKSPTLTSKCFRTYFTSFKQVQQHANKFLNALRITNYNEGSSFDDVANYVSDNVHFNLSNIQTTTKQGYIDMHKLIVQMGKTSQIQGQVFRWTPNSYAMYTLSRFIDYSSNREAINAGVTIISVDDEGLIKSMAGSDNGSLGPMDDLLDLPNRENQPKYFDSMGKAQEWVSNYTQSMEKDVNEKNFGDGGKNSQYLNTYWKDDSVFMSANLAFYGKDAVELLEGTSNISKSTKYTANIHSFGDYSIYLTTHWSHVYNDGTHNTISAEQISFVDDDGKKTAVHSIFDPKGLETHIKKVEELNS